MTKKTRIKSAKCYWFFYVFILERKCEQGRGTEGEREKLKQAPQSTESNAGLDPMTLGS